MPKKTPKEKADMSTDKNNDTQIMVPPLVSIGMPVFNEERFLRNSLEALVCQDYENIELIISDNASTDATEAICREYAAKYDWIRYHRFDVNTGAANNHIYALGTSSGKYFMWAAGHDLWSSNYLSSCVNALESHPKAVIAYGSSTWIDEEGLPFDRESGWIDTRGMDIIARYFTIFWGNMHPILGVMRRKSLISLPILNTAGADLIILTGFSLQGDFIHAVETSWSRREFRIETSHKDKLKRYESEYFKISNSIFTKTFPLARLPFELVKIVISANISLAVKLLILPLLLISFPVRYFSGKRNN
jgi:glycosyltransferase involved in cell wall biosynthesis